MSSEHRLLMSIRDALHQQNKILELISSSLARIEANTSESRGAAVELRDTVDLLCGHLEVAGVRTPPAEGDDTDFDADSDEGASSISTGVELQAVLDTPHCASSGQ